MRPASRLPWRRARVPPPERLSAHLLSRQAPRLFGRSPGRRVDESNALPLGSLRIQTGLSTTAQYPPSLGRRPESNRPPGWSHPGFNVLTEDQSATPTMGLPEIESGTLGSTQALILDQTRWARQGSNLRPSPRRGAALPAAPRALGGREGIEPSGLGLITPSAARQNLARVLTSGGGEDRTPDLLLAGQMPSHLATPPGAAGPFPRLRSTFWIQ